MDFRKVIDSTQMTTAAKHDNVLLLSISLF